MRPTEVYALLTRAEPKSGPGLRADSLAIHSTLGLRYSLLAV